MKTFNKILFLFVSLLLLKCSSVKEVTTYNDLITTSEKGDIQLVTTDTSVYYLDKNFSFTDSSITGTGIKEKNNLTEDFKGELLFRNVSHIQTQKIDFWKSLLFVGATSAILIAGVPVITEGSGLTVTPEIVYPSGGGEGSCPYIYSWDGNKFVLEGEAFGVGLGKKLEYETCTVVPHLKNQNGKLRVRLTNERPESHFFNRVKLVAVETDVNSKVYTDNHNSLWAVKNPEKLLSALNHSENISALLEKDDNVYWQSDLSSANAKSGYEDRLYVNFLKEEKADTASLIISAINTEVSSVVFKKLQELLGNNYSDFMKAAENDPEITNILKETLVRSSLKIDVWDGKEWTYVDMIYPEANHVKFKKLLRLPLNPAAGDTIKLRLRCLTDVWKLDAVMIDESYSQKLKPVDVKIISAKSGGKDVYSSIKNIDDNYTVILPGEKIDLEFESPENTGGGRISYALLADGYLYEWLITGKGFSVNGNNNFYHSSPKMELVKELFKNMDMFLPVIYDEWRTVREKTIEVSSMSSL